MKQETKKAVFHCLYTNKTRFQLVSIITIIVDSKNKLDRSYQ